MRFLLALFALWLAVPASASTLRFEVTGQFLTYTNYLGIGFRDPVVYDIHNPILEPYLSEAFYATSGYAVLEDNAWIECGGLLRVFLCPSIARIEDMQFWAVLSNAEAYFDFTSIMYRDDARTLNGYFREIEGEITSLTVTPIPLPSSGLLLLFALAFQRWLMRTCRVGRAFRQRC